MPTFLHMGPSSARGPAIPHVGTLAHVQISGLTCGRGGYQRQQTTGGRHQRDAGAAHPRSHSEEAQASLGATVTTVSEIPTGPGAAGVTSPNFFLFVTTIGVMVS